MTVILDLDITMLLLTTAAITIYNAVTIGYYERIAKTPSLREIEISKESYRITFEKKKLNEVSSFVKVSKLQRKLDVLTKEADMLMAERVAASKIKSKPLQWVNTLIKPVFILTIGVVTWGKPLVTFANGTILMPFTRVYAMPGCVSGSISAIAWCSVLHQVASTIFKLAIKK